MKKSKPAAFQVTPTHYIRDGVRYDRVTSVLDKTQQFFVTEQRLEELAERGRRMHEICARISLGKMTQSAWAGLEDGESDFFYPRACRWREWVNLNVADVVSVERTMASSGQLFAGTVDMICILEDRKRCLIDIKTGAGNTVKNFLQLCAYWHLCLLHEIPIDVVAIAELGANGITWWRLGNAMLRPGFTYFQYLLTLARVLPGLADTGFTKTTLEAK